jgi:hypothetical protein
MAGLKKGQKLVCEPCGRQVVVDACGMSESTLWCCNQPMRPKTRKSSRKK